MEGSRFILVLTILMISLITCKGSSGQSDQILIKKVNSLRVNCLLKSKYISVKVEIPDSAVMNDILDDPSFLKLDFTLNGYSYTYGGKQVKCKRNMVFSDMLHKIDKLDSRTLVLKFWRKYFVLIDNSCHLVRLKIPSGKYEFRLRYGAGTRYEYVSNSYQLRVR